MRAMPFARVFAAAVLAATSLAGARPARADAVKTPECQRQLATTVQLIGAIKDREKRLVRGDMVRNCNLLRDNLNDMVKAREPLDRCLTGQEKGDTTGQLDASIADLRAALTGYCQQ